MAPLTGAIVISQSHRQSSQKVIRRVCVFIKDFNIDLLIVQISDCHLANKVELRIDRVRYDLRL